MKKLSETRAISLLSEIRQEFRTLIRDEFEHRAKPCASCETPGACCLDAHFVNVRITRLEASTIRNALLQLPNEMREKVFARNERTAEGMNALAEEKYSCPLFEKGIGCLVHDTAKPLPCIAHACYERKEDLPPDDLLATREIEVLKLNEKVYGVGVTVLPIPVALSKSDGFSRSVFATPDG